MKYDITIGALKQQRTDLLENEKGLCSRVIRDFVAETGKTEIEFCEENGQPSFIYIGGRGDLCDANVTNLMFDQYGNIVSIRAYLYYVQTEVEGDEDDFLGIDYVELAEYIIAEFED